MFAKKSPGGYKGTKKFGGLKKVGGWKSGGDRDERPELHDAVCNECGKSCQVPFKPNGSKPIYCRDCFRKEEEGEPRFDRPSFKKPSYEKPAYRSTPRAPQNDNAEVVRELRAMNAKLDQLIETLNNRS